MRTVRLLIGIGAVVLAGILGAGAPAFGHNSLTGSDPKDGATLEQAPEQVRLTFLARLDPDNAELAVTGPDGGPVDTDEPVFDGSEVTITLRPGPAGEYEVVYEVLSADGDWVDGEVRFTVTEGVEPTPMPAPSSQPAVTIAPTESPAPAIATVTAERTGGSGTWWPWLLAALALAGGGLAGYHFRRRQRAAGG